MKAIIQTVAGGPETLIWGKAPKPAPGDNEILIRVHASSFNPADVGTREGRYLEENEKPKILGLECSGIVEAVGANVTKWQPNDRVCALLTQGGYAEFVAVNENMVLPVPEPLSLLEAASLPESLCTVWSNFAMIPNPMAPRKTLIHGGSGSIGAIAIQMAKSRGDMVFTTVGSETAVRMAESLGADRAINYKDEDFADVVMQETNGAGVDQILDIIGADYFDRNIEALATDGHLAVISVQGGAKITTNLFELMLKRITVTTTMLKNRPESAGKQHQLTKAEIISGVLKEFWPAVSDGTIKPVIGQVLPLENAREAHEQFALKKQPAGKTVFKVG